MTSEIIPPISDPAVRTRVEEIKGMEDFPKPRGTANALIRLTQREGTSLAVMAHALKSDPTLSVRVIRVANAVGGGEHGPLVSLRDAVDVLGVPPVRSLALGFSLMETYRGGQCREFAYSRFWSQALARAVALQLLTAAREGLPPADAFSVGLLAGVGELIFATVFPTPYSELLQHRAGQAAAQSAQLSKAEQEAFAVTHGALAASLLLDYDLPEIYANAVESLGLPGPANAAQGSAEANAHRLLTLADRIGAICVAAPDAARALMPELFELGLGLSFEAGQLIALCDRAAHEWREWGALLEIETGPMPHFENCAAAPLSVGVAVAATPPSPVAPSIASEVADVPPVVAPDTPPAASLDFASGVPEIERRSVGGSSAESAQVCALLVGDEARVRGPLRGMLAEAGYRVAEAADGRHGLTLAIELQPQIMLVDLLAAEIDGIELPRSLRQFKAGRSSYVLILSVAEHEEKRVAALTAGADGFLTLPLQPRLFAAQLQAGTRVAGLQAELRQEREEIRRISAELAVSNRQLQEIGMTDLLTGCRNRRYAMDRMQQEWAMAVRSQRPLACMMIDLDNMKQINDAHGHAAGDNVLKLCASALRGEMRAQDVLARSSGDEFLVICPDTSLQAALTFAERMRAAVEVLPIVDGERAVHGSVSIGVAVRDATTPDADALIRLADQSAYLAKRQRNSVVAVQSSAAPSRHSG
ncbi:MAG: diguanylate cyclase [Betaproteobacteria bacterium]|nr:diguanylate cyclase [Betaproteobacteria bacterium]